MTQGVKTSPEIKKAKSPKPSVEPEGPQLDLFG